MAMALETIAQGLHLTPTELMQRGVEAYLERELRATQMDINDLRDRYRVNDAVGLAEQIKAGTIHSHPAWEDSIEWQSLETYLRQLEQWQEELH
jgi:hypothetical protein